MPRDAVNHALKILAAIDLPTSQQNERSALTLLALGDLTPVRAWSAAATPLLGVTPIMTWAAAHYGKQYAPNSRETFRRLTLHQFVEAGLVQYNPDRADRPVNSPNAVYQLTAEAVALLRSYGGKQWAPTLAAYLVARPGLATRYAAHRDLALVSVRIPGGGEINLSPGHHSELIKAIVSDFAARFVPGAQLVYLGDTGNKFGYFDAELLASLNVTVDAHGKMPDVVLFDTARNWIILVESVTSHGPVDGKRHAELKTLFAGCTAGLVFVSAFPDRATLGRYLGVLAWETEVWLAAAPDHMLHLNGSRFLGPY